MPLQQKAQILARWPRVRRLDQLVGQRPGIGGPGQNGVEHPRRGGCVGTFKGRPTHVVGRHGCHAVAGVDDQFGLVEQNLFADGRTLGPMRPSLFAGLVHDEAEARRSAGLAHGQEPVLFGRQGEQGFGRRAGGEELDARFNLPDQAIFVGQHGDPCAGMAIDGQAKSHGGQ